MRSLDSLRSLGMTRTKDFCGTAKAVPFQNEADSEFFSNL